MLLLPPLVDIGPTEGFSPEKDIFERKELGQGLTNIMNLVTQPTVFAVDAPWGAGKTTFLKMWAGALRNDGHPVIYFDAFASDYIDDAFVALTAEVVALLDASRPASTKFKKQFVSRAIGAGKVVARSVLKIGVKAATMGALDAADVTELVDEISDETEEVIDTHIGDLITQHGARANALEAFKNCLQEIPRAVAVKGDGPAKSLVFIVDELDRCRPIFALEIIEKIKHLFSVENVHFVLGTNLDQLENSVKATYGPGIDAGTYLQKFINFIVPIPDTLEKKNINSVTLYSNYLKSEMDFPANCRDCLDEAVLFLQRFSAYRSISLRETERVMTYLALSVAYLGPNTIKPGTILGGLAIMKAMFPDLYKKVKDRSITLGMVKEALALQSEPRNGSIGYEGWQIGWWQYCLERDPPEELLNQYRAAIPSYMIRDRLQFLSMVANQIVDKHIA